MDDAARLRDSGTAAKRAQMFSFRHERGADTPAIRGVHEAAFGRADEADLVDALRRGGGLAVSVVAEVDGAIRGHVAFSPVTIGSGDDAATALALAPMAVAPEWQRRGVGSGMARWALDACRRLKHRVVIVLGDPEYYRRFGFERADAFGVRCPFSAPAEAFMLLELARGAGKALRGVVTYRPEFARVRS